MKLTSLTIHNMFSYHGTSAVSLDNISCIIGTNGFGKTSILNSIKLCLGTSDIDVNSILNNNAKEKRCWVNLNFDQFSIQRSWNFENKFEETLSVVFENDNKLEDIEAENFIKSKIPDFLIDFLFYDGEVGNNLLLLSNTRLKSIFDYIFDLDLLVNTSKDSQEVAKRLLGKNQDEESKQLLELETKRQEQIYTIAKQKEELEEKEKKYKTLKMDLQKANTQIRNRNKKTKVLHEEKESIQSQLDEKSSKLKELIMWQMPLLLNKKLLDGMKKRGSTALKVEDESLFTNRFHRFIQEINSPLDENRLLELFKSMMLNESTSIELSTTKSKFKKLLEQMKDLKISIIKVDEKIKTIEDSEMEKEMMRLLVESRDQQEVELNLFEKSLEELIDTIEQNQIKQKEINKELTKAFKTNQNKYALIKGYEELLSISKVSMKVYKKRLEEKLSSFNRKLKENTHNFLKQYEHIKDISIDSHHNIIITDAKQEKLNTELLSAGQKQVLNFLIVKTILDFKEFASFVMVDTPFGRLSNKNKELLLNSCYLSFDNLILLLTDSEFEFIKSQPLKYTHYEIQRDSIGSKIEEIV